MSSLSNEKKPPCASNWIWSPPHQFEIIDKIETKGWFGSTKVKMVYRCTACGLMTNYLD